MRKPIIGIPADRRLLNSHWFHCVGEKYIDAIVQAADAVPVLVPALGERYLREWLASFDGILFTGSPSNVEPHRYLRPEVGAGHPARPGARRHHAAHDHRRRRCGPADPRHLPRLPGDQRRARRLAHAEAPGDPGQPRPPRGHEPADGRAVRAGARDRAGGGRPPAQDRGQPPHQGQFAALAGRRAPRAAARRPRPRPRTA